MNYKKGISYQELVSFIDKIRNYKPDIIDIIFNCVFVPSCNDMDGKNVCIRALPIPGTSIIGANQFKGNKKLKLIIIDKSVTILGDSCFSDCINLEGVSIPKSVTQLCDNCFLNCNILSKIVIPDSVLYLGMCSFKNCYKLKSIKLSKNIKWLDYLTFYNCKNLKNIKLEENLEFISEGASNTLKCISIPKYADLDFYLPYKN